MRLSQHSLIATSLNVTRAKAARGGQAVGIPLLKEGVAPGLSGATLSCSKPCMLANGRVVQIFLPPKAMDVGGERRGAHPACGEAGRNVGRRSSIVSAASSAAKPKTDRRQKRARESEENSDERIILVQSQRGSPRLLLLYGTVEVRSRIQSYLQSLLWKVCVVTVGSWIYWGSCYRRGSLRRRSREAQRGRQWEVTPRAQNQELWRTITTAKLVACSRGFLLRSFFLSAWCFSAVEVGKPRRRWFANFLVMMGFFGAAEGSRETGRADRSTLAAVSTAIEPLIERRMLDGCWVNCRSILWISHSARA